jgi:NAD(P)H-hydrate epimerase
MPPHPLIFTRTALRELDRRALDDYKIPIPVLMENAGRAVAQHLLTHRPPKGRVLVLTGPGNNGGDALVTARWLANAGLPVDILLLAGRHAFSGPAAAQLATIDAMKLPVEEASPGHPELRDWIVEGQPGDVLIDGIFGTGLSRPVEGLPAEIIHAANASGRRIVAVDIPSGLNADTGEALGIAIRATETVSFCGSKTGFPKARPYTGELHIADIGIPRQLLESLAQKI